MTLLLMRQMPVATVARHIRETDTRLWRVLKAQVAAAYPKVDWSGVVCVGCDELNVRTGHHYVSVFCDLIGKRVLFATPGKDKAVWQSFVAEMDRHNGRPRAITEVSIDMSPAYVAGVKENLGDQAVIVFDKFHVIAHVNQAVDETRKEERQQVDQAEAVYLKASKWVLLKNPANHTEKQAAHYQGLLNRNLATVKAHEMRLAMQENRWCTSAHERDRTVIDVLGEICPTMGRDTASPECSGKQASESRHTCEASWCTFSHSGRRRRSSPSRLGGRVVFPYAVSLPDGP